MIGEKTATMLKTHLLGERYAAYCNCKKLKESKLAGSFSEVFLLLLTLMRFSPYQSCINNFCCVASVGAAAYKMKQTRCDSEPGSREGRGDEHRGAEPFGWVIDLQIHVWQGWMSAVSLLVQLSPHRIVCAGFGWEDFGEWKVYLVKAKMSQTVLRAVFIAKGISRKANFLRWGGGRGRREGLDRDQLP